MENTTKSRWAGIDWGDRKHHVCIVDADGNRVGSFPVDHSAEGLEALLAKLRDHGPIAGVAIETSRHILISKLLDANITVYPVNAKIASRWRECFAVDPAKDDGSDAFNLAYNIRCLHGRFRPLRPDDAATRELATLCRDQADVVAERTRIANKLKACLKTYYPQALEWFTDWTTPTAADFVLAFPTPQTLAQAPDNKLITFLRCHHIGLTQTWKSHLAARHNATPWPTDPPIEAAKSVQALCLAKQLRTLNAGLKTYEKHIQTLFAQHPDAHIFSSLPGAGPKLAPRLLTHVGSDRERYPSAKPLQALSGTVPVKTRSGKTDIDRFRWACRKDFRNTMFFFALQTIERSVWARAYYDQLRAKGRTHPQALRALGAKWLKIIHRMWHDRKPYDERLYLAALIRHNSPLIAHIRSSKKCEEISTHPLT